MTNASTPISGSRTRGAVGRGAALGALTNARWRRDIIGTPREILRIISTHGGCWERGSRQRARVGRGVPEGRVATGQDVLSPRPLSTLRGQASAYRSHPDFTQ